MINRIIEEANRKREAREGREAVFKDTKYKAVEFSQTNFRELGKGEGKELAFIDGGNSEIIGMPGMSVQLMRNAAVKVKDGKVAAAKAREFYLVANERKGEVNAVIYSDGEEIELKEKMSLTGFCDAIRKASEIKFAIETAEGINGGAVVLDGTLEAMNEIEKRHFDQLYDEAKNKEIAVAAVAKTTTLTADSGMPFGQMLGMLKEGKWLYHPVAEFENERHQAEMAFARLHEKSRHVFRIDFHDAQKGKIIETAAEIADNAKELTFPGYPYGLIMADRLARVSEKEKEYAKAKMLATAGEKWEGIRRNMAATNAHSILDSM